jgi:hypothetical protein
MFNDVTVGDNSVGAPLNITRFSAGPGWDYAKGWGSEGEQSRARTSGREPLSGAHSD